MIKHKLFIFMSKAIIPLFFDKRYLTGRWFNDNIQGWKWAWRSLLFQKIFGINRHIPFPVSHNSTFGKASNLIFNVDDLNNFQHFGCYFQNWNEGKIIIGKGSYIAPNVGLITENHNIYNLNLHTQSKDVVIGNYCWIGMNSVLLPGVKLGDHTIVGAGAVVTKSYPEGWSIIGGVPAVEIKRLDKEEVKVND